MSEIFEEREQVVVEWYHKFYVCSECGTTWTDEWSCLCNDRCPECDCEIELTSAINMSRPLIEEDYQGAMRLMMDTGIFDGTPVADNQAKRYAEAILEGDRYRFLEP